MLITYLIGINGISTDASSKYKKRANETTQLITKHSCMKPIKSFMYSPTEIQLAHEIADRLNDPEAMSLYLSYTQQFPHEKLKEILNKVCSIPDRNIRRTRGALFTFLVGQYRQYGNGRSGY